MVTKGDEDISPYATFHLLGMREENKNNGGPNPQNFKTLQPNQSMAGSMGPSMAGTMASGMVPPGMVQHTGPQTGPNTPAHQRHMSQTMNPNARMSLMSNPGGNGPMGPMHPMPPVPPQHEQQVYDAPNCDYDPPSYMDQNFGNPYDCPEGMYNGSMMSSVGYSQVSDHAATNLPPGMGGGGMPFPPRGGQPLPGMTVMTALPPVPPPSQQQQVVNNIPGNTDTVIFKPEGRGASHIAGLQPQVVRQIPQQFEDDAFPPPPPVRPGNGGQPGSADVSLNDSASTTQSNVTSECSEAECDREPLVKTGNNVGGNRASVGSPRDLSTEEMRKLLERNEVVQGGGGAGLQPFDLGNV
jgi:hypothetical protein